VADLARPAVRAAFDRGFADPAPGFHRPASLVIADDLVDSRLWPRENLGSGGEAAGLELADQPPQPLGLFFSRPSRVFGGACAGECITPSDES